MWELSCLCNLNSASVCISTKIKSPMISHAILCHTSVRRRDCAEFLFTAFLLCVQQVDPVCHILLKYSSEDGIFSQRFLHRLYNNRGQLLHEHSLWYFCTILFVRSIVYHCSHFADEEQRCNVIKVEGILYFGVPILRPLRPGFPDGLSHLLLLQQWAQSAPACQAQGSNQALKMKHR